LPDHKVRRAQLALPVRKEFKAKEARRDLKVIQDLPVLLDQQVQPDQQVQHQQLPVLKGKRDPQDRQARRVQQVPQDQ
jgi:hypothetical protein